MVTLGDVFPGIGVFAPEQLGVIVGDADGLEELAATLLTRESLKDGQLVPPVGARLVPLILEDEHLRNQQYVHLFPDLVRSSAHVASSAGVSRGLAEQLSRVRGCRWQSLELSPANAEAEWGRSAALELTAVAAR